MRNTITLTLALVFSMLFATTDCALAVPITGGTGPGGVGLSDGSSNLQAWFRADTLGLSGGAAVTSWTDSSGNGADATDLTVVANQPTFQTGVFNGQPVVRFDGTDLLATTDTGAYSGDQAHTVVGAFSVDTFGATSHQRPLFGIGNDIGNSADRRIVHLAFENSTTTVDRLAGGAITYTTATGTGSLRTLANRYVGGGATTANYSLRFDGTLQAASGGTASLHNFTSGEIRLADQAPTSQTGGPNFDGDIAEIAFFNRSLNTAELIIVDNYLAAKYDKTASGSGVIANDRYVGDENVNGDYDFDVFGIGRVDSTNLLENTGSAGFGIDATNALDDGDFMLTGHKVASNTQLDSRWDRTWFLDNQLDGDELLDLAFDWSDASLGSADPAFLNLLYSASDGGSFSTIAIGSLAGDTVTFSSLLASELANGYYTLGSPPPVPEPSSVLLLGLGALGLLRHTRRRRRA